MTLCLSAAADEAVDVEKLKEGQWTVAFVVLPEVPECKLAIEWLGELQHSFPEMQFLVLSPWLTDDLRDAAARAELPVARDEESQLGKILGIDDVPTILTLREGRVADRLVWPFPQEAVREAVEKLAFTPDDGPTALLDEGISLGKATTLEGEEVDLDNTEHPVLLSFFQPMCPACWRALPTLVELKDDIEVVLVVLEAGAMTDSEQAELQETGLTVVLDDARQLLEALRVRSTPTYILRDETGTIRWVKEGVAELEELRDQT